MKNLFAWIHKPSKPKFDGTISVSVELVGRNTTVAALNQLAQTFLDASNSMSIAADTLARFPEDDEDDEDDEE